MIGQRLVLVLVCAVVCLAPASSLAENFVINVIDPMAFEPNEIIIHVGDTVTFQKGTTTAVHNVRSEALDDQCTFGPGCFRCGAGSGCQGQGATGDPTLDPWSVTLSFFDQPGTVPFRCGPHGSMGMTGRIIVQEGPPPPPPPTNTAGKIRFSSGTSNHGEGTGAAAIQVERTNGNSGVVGVTYASVAGGSAASGGDFAPVTGTLSWANGEGGVKTFNLEILDDATDEANETIKLALSAPSGGATLANPSTATVVIVDDDGVDGSGGGTIEFTSASFGAAETAPLATVTVKRIGSSQGAVSVDYDTANGTATAGQDYTHVGGTLDWASGDTADKSFSVPILDDLASESSETISVSLSQPVGATIGSPATTMVTLFDDESVPPCVDGELQVCLLDRFLATIRWVRPNQQAGEGRVTKLTDSAAAFEFFEPGNVEVVLKMKNACALPPGNPLRSYWPFIAGLTNVRVEVTIVDTESGAVRRFYNALNEAFFTPAADSPDGQTNPPGAIQAATEALGSFATCDL